MNRIPPGRKPRGGKGSKNDPEILTLGMEKDEDAAILERARKRFDLCISSEAENRTNALKDLKFKAGDQWDASIAAQRNNDHRPCITVNKIPTFVNQVTNEQRINRPSINVSPVGDRSDPEVAKMYRGLIRFFERESHADLAYDTAFDSAASIGWGYLRMGTEFVSPETFDQTITITRIRNTLTVYMDPMAQQPDAADAKYCFITELIPREEFAEMYPDADPMSWTESAIGDTFKNWVQDKNIRIAEYFEITHDDRTLISLSNGHVGWKDELSDDVKDDIASGRIEVMAERDSSVPAVKWYKHTATQILDRGDWAGKWLPVPRVIGNEVDIEGKVTLSGIIRSAVEPQRLFNYAHTSMVEVIALQPKAPYIGAEGQFEGHEDKWQNANIKSYPYLEYNPVALQGQVLSAPQRQPPPQASSGWQQLNEAFAQDMMATTGIRFDATLQERVVDESGRALRELRRSSDTGTLHYYDNLCRTLKHVGEMFIDLIPKVIDTRRMVTILREDDTEEQVMIDPNAEKPYAKGRHPLTNKVLKIFNPTIGKYGVTVTIGPSYASKRIESAESMMDFVRAMPQTAQLVADLIAKNQDWPEAEQFAARLAKALPPGLLTPPEMDDLPPQVQALIGSLQKQLQALTQQFAAAQKELTDKRGDQAIRIDANQKNFEEALLKVVADVETKMAKVQAGIETSFMTHIGGRLQELGAGVGELMKAIEANAPDALPAEAMQHLAEGQVTHFANGQKYTLADGKPKRVLDA